MPDESSQQRGRETREDILHTARRLFSEYGYHATGIADIQAATGLTKGAFYHHFRAKEELALAILELAGSDYQACLLEPFARLTPGRRLAATLDELVTLNARPEWRNCQMLATLCAELTHQEPRLQEAVRAIQNAMFDFWKDLIEQACRSGEARAEIDASTWAQWIVNTLMGAQLTRKLGSARVPAEQILKTLKHSILIHDV